MDVFIQKKKDKADGQKVKTFVSDNWTLEYDLAMSGLLDEMIDSLSDLYNEDAIEQEPKENRETKKNDFRATMRSEIMACASAEERAAMFQRYFIKNLVSKAAFAQLLAAMLELEYAGNPKNTDNSRKVEALRAKLPKYLIDAILYVTE